MKWIIFHRQLDFHKKIIYNPLINADKGVYKFLCLRFLLCDSKNKPPAMQGEGRSLDISNLLR